MIRYMALLVGWNTNFCCPLKGCPTEGHSSYPTEQDKHYVSIEQTQRFFTSLKSLNYSRNLVFYGTQKFTVFATARQLSIVSYKTPVHNLPSYVHTIHFNIIHPFSFRFCEWSFLFRLSNQYVIRYSSSTYSYYTIRPSSPTWLVYPNNIW